MVWWHTINWWHTIKEIADEEGKGTGKFRQTVESDEGGGGPFGCPECFHENSLEAENCEKCDEFCSGITGFPTKKQTAIDEEARERAELSRLKAKYGE